MDTKLFEPTTETQALLKILVLGNRQIEQGKTVTVAEAITRLRSNHG